MLGPGWVLGSNGGQAGTVLVLTGLSHSAQGRLTLTKYINRRDIPKESSRGCDRDYQAAVVVAMVPEGPSEKVTSRLSPDQ